MAEPNNPIEAVLIRLRQERTELDNLIAALEKRQGISTTSTNGTVSVSTRTSAPSGIYYRGELFNLSITRAAEKVLRRAQIPLKTPQIMDAFEKAGYEVRGKTPRASVYTALARSKMFVKVLPDTWDLSERHPEAAAQKEQEIQQSKGKGGRRKRRIKEDKSEDRSSTGVLRTVA